MLMKLLPWEVVGMVYLLLIMYALTGHTPMDLVDAMTDIITQPLETISITLG